jgi:hypothetical protein
MNAILVNLTPNNKVGFSNHIYIIAKSISYATQNNINLIFYTKYLQEINTDNYTFISNIIDMNATNKFLSKYNIQIVDYYNYTFEITDVEYGNKEFNMSIYKDIVNNNSLKLDKYFSFESYFKYLSNLHLKKYYIPCKTDTIKLIIKYKLNSNNYNIEYNIIDNHLENNIYIDYKNLSPITFNVNFDMTNVFYDVKTNIVFNKTFSDNIASFTEKNNINKNININCIHLRLEKDGVSHWAKENNLSESDFLYKSSQKYISEIKKYIKKDELTIILSSDYNNDVIKYLHDNNYNFITTPIWHEFRDISAIYDLHIGQLCNNTYICIYESSFSYLLLYRIKHKLKQMAIIEFNK